MDTSTLLLQDWEEDRWGAGTDTEQKVKVIGFHPLSWYLLDIYYAPVIVPAPRDGPNGGKKGLGDSIRVRVEGSWEIGNRSIKVRLGEPGRIPGGRDVLVGLGR